MVVRSVVLSHRTGCYKASWLNLAQGCFINRLEIGNRGNLQQMVVRSVVLSHRTGCYKASWFNLAQGSIVYRLEIGNRGYLYRYGD